MARDAVTVNQLVLNDSLAAATGTAINTTNGASIDLAGYKGQTIIVEVKNTAGAAYDVTFKAGDNPPAFRAGLGDLVEEIPATSGDEIFVLETARFMQNDGKIYADFETSMTGYIKAYAMPTGAA